MYKRLLKSFSTLKISLIAFLILGSLYSIYQTNKFNQTSQRNTIQTRAATEEKLTIMTFNVLGEPLCKPRDHEKDMQAIVELIKRKGISVVALQETIKMENDCNDFDMPDIVKDLLTGSDYEVKERRYIGSDDKKWYRLFIYQDALISEASSSVDSSNSQGAEAYVLDTQLGKIRFINLHPQPGTQALNLDKMLIPFIEQFKGDGIPMVIMGDFNLRYDFADAAPVLKKIEEAGFKRACETCTDTIKKTGSNDNFAVDYIFIDNRANFFVSDAYVEQTLTFSDHLPIIVTLSKNPPVTPTPTGFATNTPTPTIMSGCVPSELSMSFAQSNQLVFSWKTCPGSQNPYKIEIMRQNETTPFASAITEASPYTFTNTDFPDGAYQWAVWHCNSTCTSGFRSEISTFSKASITWGDPAQCPKKGQGDANCDGTIDVTDYACWRETYLTGLLPGTGDKPCKTADFDGVQGVTILDFSIWLLNRK